MILSKLSETLDLLHRLTKHDCHVRIYVHGQQIFERVYPADLVNVHYHKVLRWNIATTKKANTMLYVRKKFPHATDLRMVKKFMAKKQYNEGVLYEAESDMLVVVHGDCPAMDDATVYWTLRYIYQRKFEALRRFFPQETMLEIHSIKLKLEEMAELAAV